MDSYSLDWFTVFWNLIFQNWPGNSVTFSIKSVLPFLSFCTGNSTTSNLNSKARYLWFVFYFFYVTVQQNELSIWVEYLGLRALNPLQWVYTSHPHLYHGQLLWTLIYYLSLLRAFQNHPFKWVPTLFHPNHFLYKSQSVHFTSQIWLCHFVHWNSSIVSSFRSWISIVLRITPGSGRLIKRAIFHENQNLALNLHLFTLYVYFHFIYTFRTLWASNFKNVVFFLLDCHTQYSVILQNKTNSLQVECVLGGFG